MLSVNAQPALGGHATNTHRMAPQSQPGPGHGHELCVQRRRTPGSQRRGPIYEKSSLLKPVNQYHQVLFHPPKQEFFRNETGDQSQKKHLKGENGTARHCFKISLRKTPPFFLKLQMYITHQVIFYLYEVFSHLWTLPTFLYMCLPSSYLIIYLSPSFHEPSSPPVIACLKHWLLVGH